MTRDRFIRRFEALGLDDVALVGGKNASLGELYRELTPLGVPVPNGFAITAEAYRHVLEEAQAWSPLREALSGLDPTDVEDLATRGRRARQIVFDAGLPEDLVDEIRDAYRDLEAECDGPLSVAVRSSATAEDLPTASFAGQHLSLIHI